VKKNFVVLVIFWVFDWVVVVATSLLLLPHNSQHHEEGAAIAFISGFRTVGRSPIQAIISIGKEGCNELMRKRCSIFVV
jgi:hypothetical protein